jgi:hypothetical protein
MNFKEMDPAKIQELLEQTDEQGQRLYQNLLAPLIAQEESILRTAVCPRCGSSIHETFVDPKHPFMPGSLLPHKLLRCLQCEVEFDPSSKVITAE